MIKYDDDDSEDITTPELIEGIDLYKLYPNEYRYSGISTKSKDLTMYPNAPPPPNSIDSTLPPHIKWKDKLSDTPRERRDNSDQQKNTVETSTDQDDMGDIPLSEINRGVDILPQH